MIQKNNFSIEKAVAKQPEGHSCPVHKAKLTKNTLFVDQSAFSNLYVITYLTRISVLQYFLKQRLGIKMPVVKIWSQESGSRKATCAADFKSSVLKGKFAYNFFIIA